MFEGPTCQLWQNEDPIETRPDVRKRWQSERVLVLFCLLSIGRDGCEKHAKPLALSVAHAWCPWYC
jgi:hypothetical protein